MLLQFVTLNNYNKEISTMPDFEKLIRSLELHVAETPEQTAFVRGKHAGEDAARWQIAKIVAVVALIVVVAINYLR